MSPVSYGKGAPKKATKLHSLIVRSRGACENCGERDYSKLQAAHIVSRKYAKTRTDETNAYCLCATCHWRFTNWPLEFAAFVLDHLGDEAYNALRAKAHDTTTKVDWNAEVARLEARWAAISSRVEAS